MQESKLRHLRGISVRNLKLPETCRPDSANGGVPRIEGVDEHDQNDASWRDQGTKELPALENQVRTRCLQSDVNHAARPVAPGNEGDDDDDDGDAALVAEAGHQGPHCRDEFPAQMSSPSGARPRAGLRRRSTLSWVNASPETRQQTMQHVVAQRRLDSFYTLHWPAAGSEPCYVSELCQRAMNVDFRFIQKDFGDRASMRQSWLTIKVWVTTDHMRSFINLIEADVFLPSLTYLAVGLDEYYGSLPDNTIVFHLPDGAYTNLPVPAAIRHGPGALAAPKKPVRQMTGQQSYTSSFNDLMKLKNLLQCIEDAVDTQKEVARQIMALIDDSKEATARKIVDEAESQRNRLASVATEKSKLERELAKLKAERQAVQKSLKVRRDELRRARLALDAAESEVEKACAAIEKRKEDHEAMLPEMQGQKRRVAEGLITIFRIESVHGRTLCFTINGCFLPNAKGFETDERLDEAVTAAALGMAAHLVGLLAAKLAIPLAYGVMARGSTSAMMDRITSMKDLRSSGMAYEKGPGAEQASRVFPLHQQGQDPKRFRYGVYLLNRDIETVMSKSGLRVVDVRDTLPNLKYLLAALASGKGEMARRKAGTVEGLRAQSHVDRFRSLVRNGP